MHGEESLSQELTHHPAPLGVAEVGADAEGAQRVVLLFHNARGLFAAEDVDEVARAESLVALALQAHHGGEELLGGNRAVPRLGRTQAGVTVAAGLRLLTEVGEQLHASALKRFAQREHGVEVLPESLAMSAVTLALVDHPALLNHVLQSIREPCGGGESVSTGTTGLLVVALDAFRQVEVGDEPHVGFVDAHSEGDGRNHHHAVLAEES